MRHSTENLPVRREKQHRFEFRGAHFYFRESASHDHHVLRSARRSTNPQEEQSLRRSPPFLRRPAAAEILLEINSGSSSPSKDIDLVQVPGNALVLSSRGVARSSCELLIRLAQMTTRTGQKRRLVRAA